MLPHSRFKARQKALLRAKKFNKDLPLAGSAMVGGTLDPSDDFGSARNIVLQLDTQVNFSLIQVLDHELRLFRELE